MNIVSKETIRREYEHLARHESMHDAINWTAAKLGLSEAAVAAIINEKVETA